MPIIVRDYHSQLIETMRDLGGRPAKWWAAAINLGGVPGSGGGVGVPIGGIYGQLIQSKVAYDTTEAVYSGIQSAPPSGSLVDNLAHIRFTSSGLDDRVTILEEVGILQVEDESVLVTSGVTVLDFQGAGVEVTSPSAGRTTITVSGLNIEDEGISVASGVTILDFKGTPVIATDSGFGRVTITVSSIAPLHVYNELVSGIPASSGYGYSTAYPFLLNTLRIYYNGLRQSPTYFTEISTSGFTTTFPTIDGDEILVDYDRSAASIAGWGNEWGSLPWGS